MKDGAEKISDATWFIHPYFQYSGNRAIHDIALLRLGQQFTRHKSERIYYLINPICLPDIDTVRKPVVNRREEWATAFGFGVIDEHHTQVERLQKAHYLINASADCETIICVKYAAQNTSAQNCPVIHLIYTRFNVVSININNIFKI